MLLDKIPKNLGQPWNQAVGAGSKNFEKKKRQKKPRQSQTVGKNTVTKGATGEDSEGNEEHVTRNTESNT